MFFWRPYLRWAYGQGIKDLTRLSRSVIFTQKEFTCLLSGVGGEITADEFISFVLKKNKNAKVYVIDLGKEQTRAVKWLVSKKYYGYDVHVQEANAMDLSFLKTSSVDWIETDGLLEYFDEHSLNKLLEEWKRILKDTGFITIREFASEGAVGNTIDKFRVWIGKTYLGVKFYVYTKKSLESIFRKNGFRFASGKSPYPSYVRYTLIKT